MLKHAPIFLLILIFLAASCAGPQLTSSEVKNQARGIETRGVWHLINEDQISLQFKNIKTCGRRAVTLDRGLTVRPFTEGVWELVSIELNNQTYIAAVTGSKFVINIKKNVHSYAGSLIIGRPKVKSDNLRHLESMAFFNRYYFRSPTETCEIIVGNDRESVRTEFRKNSNNSNLDLLLAF